MQVHHPISLLCHVRVMPIISTLPGSDVNTSPKLAIIHPGLLFGFRSMPNPDKDRYLFTEQCNSFPQNAPPVLSILDPDCTLNQLP